VAPDRTPNGTTNGNASPARDLRRAQALGVGGILAGLAALLIWLSATAVTERSFSALRDRGAALARFLALTGEAALSGEGGGDLQEVLDRVASEGGLVYVGVIDPEGAVLAEAGPSERPASGALAERATGALRAPLDADDIVPGTARAPLYLFTYPLRRRGPDRPAGLAPQAREGSPFGPRAAEAAPRERAAASRLLGEVRVVLGQGDLLEARRAVVFRGAGLGLLAVLAGVLLTQVLSRRLVAPPAARLEDLAVRLNEVVEEIKASAQLLVAGTLNQQEALKRISGAVEGMTHTIREVAGSVGSLSATSEETSTSILAMVASIEEVAGHADGLTMSVNDTTATTEEVVASIKEIDRNVELLDQFVAETSGSIGQMGRSIQQVEKNAADGQEISGLVARNAEVGMRAVTLTNEAMETIRGSVQQTSRAIESVGRRGQEIGLILKVIQEVTEQTNLLALNAAIIAAQAGEHGRGFAVVAEEIRQLAERTATSAKEIGQLIASFQADTVSAVTAMQEGSRRVEEGSERSREAGRALTEILESARRSSTMVGEIAAATRDQARGSQAISGAVEKVREMVAHIKRATAGQTLGSEQIMSAVQNMREMAGHVKRATVEQARGSRQITEAIEAVTERVGSVHRAASDGSSAADQILQILAGFASVTAANLASATRMREAMDVLQDRESSLRRDIARFRAGA
jgi:methyl-accepting chemotaxis protein